MGKKSDEDLQELIDLTLKKNPNVNFKECKECGRHLPATETFYVAMPKCKFGVSTKCKECSSINNSYSFSDILHPWYGNVEDLYLNYRKMSFGQVENFYNKSNNAIKEVLRKNGYIVDKNEINKNLEEDEIIFMYESLLKGEIKSFGNGLLKTEKSNDYIIIIVKHLISNILKWDREEICTKYNINILVKYKLGGVINAFNSGIYKLISCVYPESNIKPWELRASSCAWDDTTLKEFKIWIKARLLIEKEIDNITKAGLYGFQKLQDDYELCGLTATKFNNSATKLFEYVFDEEFNKNEMLKMNFTFKIKEDDGNKNRKLEGKIYKLTNEYHTLDDRGRTLINEVIRYCEDNNKFPEDKDLTKKNGYISRTQFYKYFNSKNLVEVYKYIMPIDTGNKGGSIKRLIKVEKVKPKATICIKCGIEKPFTSEYFCSGKANKYGLKYECKDCAAKESTKTNYAKKSIFFNDIEDISVENWYEYFINGTIGFMPEFCYKEENEILIIRYIFINKLKCNNKETLLENFTRPTLEKYRLEMIVNRLGNKSIALQKCFSEYSFCEDDFNMYSEEKMNKIIQEWVIVNDLTITDILKRSFSECNKKLDKINVIDNLRAARFKATNEVFIWYFKYNNIKHPNYNREIKLIDFYYQPSGFWSNKENRINKIKNYCEEECDINIFDVINDTEELKKWVYYNFRQEDVVKLIANYNDYTTGLYGLLIESYPQILENKTLFEWEWHIVTRYNKPLLIKMLQDLVEFRLSDLIKNPIEDIPKYLNKNFMKEMFSKFNKHIIRKRFESYFDWACEAFPEYKSGWKKEDFGHIISFDGIEFDSYQEKDVYEFIKKEPVLQYIKPIGRNKIGKYTFELGDDYEYERFCPDFVIEEISLEEKRKRLKKPIIIEFYGMYAEANTHRIFKNYYKKTQAKEQFYKNNKDIYYIGIFPNDIKNNYKGLKQKLEAFFMSNFNIDINK